MRLGTDGWYCVAKGKIRPGFSFVLSGELASCLQNSLLSGFFEHDSLGNLS